MKALPLPWITDRKPPAMVEVIGLMFAYGRARRVWAVWMGEMHGWAVNMMVNQPVIGWCEPPPIPTTKELSE